MWETTQLKRPIQKFGIHYWSRDSPQVCIFITITSPPRLHPGPPARHSDGRLSAVHPEHLRSDPLPQDDLVGGNRRRLRDVHHCLHLLLHSECVTYFHFGPSVEAHWGRGLAWFVLKSEV